MLSSLTISGSTASSNAVSLWPYILFNQSYGQNILDPSGDAIAKLCRPFDERDLVRTNEDIDAMSVGLEQRALGGCVETQEGEDDELIIHVSPEGSFPFFSHFTISHLSSTSR